MPHLTPDQFRPFLSSYLMGGWREDDLILASVRVEPGCICGVVRVNEYFESTEGGYHLAVPSAFIWVAQLAIIYGCWDESLPCKPGEIYVRDIHLKCRRPVTSTDGLEFVLTLATKRTIPDGIYYAGHVSIDRGAFVGEGRFVLPVPTGVTESRRVLTDGALRR